MTILELISKIKSSDLISIFALIISGVSIFWNIYRDIILKAKLRVVVQISDVVQPGKNWGTFISITGTNCGPGSIICETIWIKKKSFWLWLRRKSRLGFVVSDYTNQLSSKLPKKLAVGERVQLLFPYEEKMFLAKRPTQVGLMDSFGRIHWATKKSLEESIKRYLKKFPKEKWGE
jgi:hypothetical protein